MKLPSGNRETLHRDVVREISRIESELHALKLCLDPYATPGDACLFDAIQDARLILEPLATA